MMVLRGWDPLDHPLITEIPLNSEETKTCLQLMMMRWWANPFITPDYGIPAQPPLKKGKPGTWRSRIDPSTPTLP